MLWNTTYENAAVEALREAGEEVRDEDVARLSPLVTAHLNGMGRYSFAAPHLEARLRPLRDPDETEPEP